MVGKLRYYWQLVWSTGYFLMLSAVIAGFTETSLLLNLVLVVLAAVTVFLVGLALAVRWAVRAEQQRPQFSLGTVLFVTTLAAIYFGVTRLLGGGMRAESWGGWIGAFIYSGLLLLLACPATLWLGDSVLALAAWIVNRPSVQRWIARRRTKRREI